MLRRFVLPLAVVFAACPKPQAVTQPDAGTSLVVAGDAGARITAEKLDAWLRWQDAVFALPFDGGADVRQRAKDEARLLAQVGLSATDADALEAVISAVVAERNVAKISGAEALAQFKDGLQALSPEQRAKAEAALAEVPGKPAGDGLADVELELGADAVRVVLAREADVTRVWERVLEAQGQK